MLSTLPFGVSPPHYDASHNRHSLPEAIKRFQTEHDLVVDGDAGPVTRQAILTEYMAADETTLAKDVRMTAHGCGQSFLAVETGDDVEEPNNRRVEVFFFPRGVEPVPTAKTSGSEVPWYPAWLDVIDEERTFTPNEAGHGRLYLVTDIESTHVEAAGVTFRLEATDGAYCQLLDPVADGIHKHGRIDLDFTARPRGSFYTLTAIYRSGAETRLFDDVPFPELGVISKTRDEELVGPFERSSDSP